MRHQRLNKRALARPTQVRRAFTAAGFPLASVEGKTISGVPGWTFEVTLQANERSHGVSIWAHLLELNRKGKAAIIRARAMTTDPPPEIGDSQVILRLEDYLDLLVFKHEHEQKGCT